MQHNGKGRGKPTTTELRARRRAEAERTVERLTITVWELSRQLGIGENRCRDLLKKGEIPGWMEGNRWIIPADAADTYIQRKIASHAALTREHQRAPAD